MSSFNHIYLKELEIKNTIDIMKSASFLDLLLQIDGKLKKLEKNYTTGTMKSASFIGLLLQIDGKLKKLESDYITGTMKSVSFTGLLLQIDEKGKLMTSQSVSSNFLSSVGTSLPFSTCLWSSYQNSYVKPEQLLNRARLLTITLPEKG